MQLYVSSCSVNVTELTITAASGGAAGENEPPLEYLATVAARVRDFVVANTARA